MAMNVAPKTLDNFAGVVKKLSAWGVPVKMRTGWRTKQARSDIKYSPEAVTVHHTGGRGTTDGMLFDVGNGVVKGPLCHFTVYSDSKSGYATAVLGAGGYANHVGINNKAAAQDILNGGPLTKEVHPGKDNPGYSANRFTVGIEVKTGGAFTTAQYKTTVALCAALVMQFGWSRVDPEIGGHKEFTARKNDPVFDMAKFRRDVVKFIGEKGGKIPAPSTDPKPVVDTDSESPKFPLPTGLYFGPKEGGPSSISGYAEKRYGKKLDRTWLKDWQTEAKKRGLYEGEIDGLYGPKTRAAIKAVQEANGLKVDGLLGPKTWPAVWTSKT